ncbi:MAG: glycyl-radical enzyme activating protein [Deltaproteobacteria bacterium]|nr:glycyl-radical enzyme activating protein [Deltaproteobacteria bacterium]
MKRLSNGVIFDIEHYAIHDGPGIRTTVFMKGCPLKCRWCANPESQNTQPEILYNRNLCTLCGECVQACPTGSISIVAGQRLLDRRSCDACSRCVDVCQQDALEICGYSLDLQSAWNRIRDDLIFWDRSGGGVTLSGGEPLMQPEFTLKFLDFCRQNKVHTVVETCGQVPEEHLRSILPVVDIVLFDYKTASPDKHKQHTGVSNEQITRNLIALLKGPSEVLVRMPLVPGINDSMEDLMAVGDLLSRTRPGAKFELLPYHRLGEGKYEKLGRNYMLKEVTPPTLDLLEAAMDVLSGYGLSLITPRIGDQN